MATIVSMERASRKPGAIHDFVDLVSHFEQVRCDFVAQVVEAQVLMPSIRNPRVNVALTDLVSSARLTTLH